MPRKRTSRIYSRTRNGTTRYYGDFRDYSDVGGKQEALIPEDQRSATTDSDVAAKLVEDRLQELEKKRRGKDLLGIERESTLKEFAAHHLRERAKSGKLVEETLAYMETHLAAAIGFFGAERDLRAIDARAVRRWVDHLALQPSGRDQSCPECDAPGSKTMSAGDPADPLLWTCPVCLEERDREVKYRVPGLQPGTQRKYINTLSNLYRLAQSEGSVEVGYNPVSALMDKPTDSGSSETEFLEVPEAALLLEAARIRERNDSAGPYPHLYELIATYLLTGGRKSEVLGLEVEDISFDRKTVRFRTNSFRRLKTRAAQRTVPLWPQLEEILRPYVFDGRGPRGRLLFPSHRVRGKEQMLNNFHKSLDEVSRLTGLDPANVHPHVLRHTYCSARLQTLDRGHPVSPFTVSKELGHGGRSLVDRVYGHLGEVRHRSDHVEYRIEQHAERVEERLSALRAHSSTL